MATVQHMQVLVPKKIYWDLNKSSLSEKLVKEINILLQDESQISTQQEGNKMTVSK